MSEYYAKNLFKNLHYDTTFIVMRFVCASLTSEIIYTHSFLFSEGFCPVGDQRPENCSISSASFLNVCKTDTDCPGTKKCCQNGCSKVCASALPVPPHQVGRRNRNPKQGWRFKIFRYFTVDHHSCLILEKR